MKLTVLVVFAAYISLLSTSVECVEFEIVVNPEPFNYNGIIARSGGIEVQDDGSVLGAGANFGSGEVSVIRQRPGGPVETVVPQGDLTQYNPIIMAGVNPETGDLSSIVATLGINVDGAVQQLTEGSVPTDPAVEQEFRNALSFAQAYFLDIGCVVVDMKVSEILYSSEALRFGLLTGTAETPEPLFEYPESFADLTVRLITVHCTSGISYRFYFYYGNVLLGGAFYEGEEFAAATTPVEIASIFGVDFKNGRKGNQQPDLALPATQSVLTTGLQTVDGFIGLSPDFQQALPTLVWRDADTLGVQEVLQLSGSPTTGNSDLRLCGKPFYEHLWMSWTSAAGTVQVAYIKDREATVMDLGPGNVTNALACDDWGNAVVAFSNFNGNTMHLRAFGPDGEDRGSASFAADEGATGMPIAVDMNNNGEVVVAWSAMSNTTYYRRATIGNVFDVDLSFDGSWNNPGFDGEGFIWDVAEVNGELTLVLYYFTYQPDGSGRQGWVVGSAPIVNGVANITMAITSGATFGSAYDPDDVTPVIWGDIEVRVTGCRSALMIMRSPLFGDLTYPIYKFTAPPTGVPGICAPALAASAKNADTKGSVTVDGSFSGSYFSPTRNFEGFIFDVTTSNGQPTVVVYWFTYDSDGSGRQLWLVGAAPISGDSVSVPLVRTEGGEYGVDYDPATIMASSFVSVTITWNDCDNATVSYQVDGGESGSFDIQRLASLPGGAGGICGS